MWATSTRDGLRRSVQTWARWGRRRVAMPHSVAVSRLGGSFTGVTVPPGRASSGRSLPTPSGVVLPGHRCPERRQDTRSCPTIIPPDRAIPPRGARARPEVVSQAHLDTIMLSGMSTEPCGGRISCPPESAKRFGAGWRSRSGPSIRSPPLSRTALSRRRGPTRPTTPATLPTSAQPLLPHPVAGNGEPDRGSILPA